jgi:hypothetical protein
VRLGIVRGYGEELQHFVKENHPHNWSKLCGCLVPATVTRLYRFFVPNVCIPFSFS